jgi:hypothetical protein
MFFQFILAPGDVEAVEVLAKEGADVIASATVLRKEARPVLRERADLDTSSVPAHLDRRATRGHHSAIVSLHAEMIIG